MIPLTLDPDAALTIRSEVARAGGREVCFLARITPERRIVGARAVARGNREAVLAAARDAEVGEILLHNHPSGLLEPSDADLALAARLYEEGVGTGIVDNEARFLYIVVEPPAPQERVRLDPDELDALLAPGGRLGDLHSGYEDRRAQRDMLREVTERYNEGGAAIVEAGTGTGKSLAYLLPAALWALRNGERTVVSTNTINLQEQLVRKDLPLLRELIGEDLTWALVKGRGNYLSIRRLHLAERSASTLFSEGRDAELKSLVEWTKATQDGSLSDLASPPSVEVWEEVRSDTDICMGARCPHFQSCFYQRARREANGAHLLVVNHALLLSDLSLRRAGGSWTSPAVLPAYRHLILDEGHNVEDAATSHLGAEVTRNGVQSALDRLDRGGKGILLAVEELLAGVMEGATAEELLDRIADKVRPGVTRAREAVVAFFDRFEVRIPARDGEPFRIGRGGPADLAEDPEILELLNRATAELDRLARELGEVRWRGEEDEEVGELLSARLLDLQGVERRLRGAAEGLTLVFGSRPAEETPFVRWVEGRGRVRGLGRNIALRAAPVEPGPILRESLFQEVETLILSSATMTVGKGDFRFLRERLGVGSPTRTLDRNFLREEADGEGEPSDGGSASLSGALATITETTLPSPFDYPNNTLFCVPSGLPGHDAGHPFQEATARIVREMAAITDGGIFVLFTSHAALRSVAALLRDGPGPTWPLFVHGEAPRGKLLADFVRSGRGILLGTTSFWEGVDVPGHPLRGLILQKIPFRVPTEPIVEARMEAIEATGRSPFNAYLVPLAALRLKQGFGRLIRSRDDRGAILLLDSRILTKAYGRVLRDALPDSPLIRGPWEEIRGRLDRFYAPEGASLADG